MKKRRNRITALILCVAILFGALCAGGIAVSVTNGLFKNNTPTYIKLGTELTGIIRSADDYEAYMFDVAQPGTIVIKLNHEDFLDSTKSGWTLSLYRVLDEAEKVYKEVAYFESFWSDMTSDWGETGLDKGTYLLMVNAGAYFLESEYTLSTTFTPTDTFEREFNDTKETSTYLQVGYGKYGVSSRRTEGADIDWFAFDLAEDSCIDVSFTHPDGTFPQVGWTVTLVNENDDKITQFTSRLTELVMKTGAIGLKAGRYYVSVEPQTELCKTYTLVVGADKAINHEFELNDRPEDAIDLPHNFAISGSLADRLLSLDKDYYKFTVDKDGYIDFTFSHERLDGNKNGWNIRIFKPMADGTYYEIVRKVSKWNEDGITIKSLGLSPGDYYVCIDGDSMSYNSATYSCKWQFTEHSSFESEPNSTYADAENIDVRTYYYGAIISSDVTYDEDYYKFTLDTTSRVCLEFGHDRKTGSNICWIASIVDTNGKAKCTLKSALNEGLLSTQVVELPAGTYYVKVETGMYGSEIPYYFKVVK